jgi:hypothetical protein
MKASLQNVAVAKPMDLRPEMGNPIKRFGAGPVREPEIAGSATVDCSASSTAVQSLFRNRGGACVAVPVARAGIIDDAVQAVKDTGQYYSDLMTNITDSLIAVNSNYPTLTMLLGVGIWCFLLTRPPVMNRIKAFAMFGEWVDPEKK